MKRLEEKGSINGLLLPLLLSIIALMFTAGFGLWAFMGRQDFKNNVDKKIASAVEVAKAQTATEKDNEFLEKEKSPTKTYTGPEAYGSLTFSYPKTWSSLVTEEVVGAATPVDGHFYPNYLPGINLQNVAYALRARIVSTSYDKTVATYAAAVSTGAAKAVPFKPEKVSNTVGVRIDGQFAANKNGAIIILPLRDKSIEIWTEAQQYVPDFDTYIVPSLSYEP